MNKEKESSDEYYRLFKEEKDNLMKEGEDLNIFKMKVNFLINENFEKLENLLNGDEVYDNEYKEVTDIICRLTINNIKSLYNICYNPEYKTNYDPKGYWFIYYSPGSNKLSQSIDEYIKKNNKIDMNEEHNVITSNDIMNGYFNRLLKDIEDYEQLESLEDIQEWVKTIHLDTICAKEMFNLKYK